MKKVNTYIVCPDNIKAILLEDAMSISKSIINMVSGMSKEAQIKHLKAHLPIQLQIQMVKAWHNENNQRERLNEIIRDQDNKIKDLTKIIQDRAK